MSIKELAPIQSRISNIDYLKNTSQYQQFDCCEIFSNVSPVNQEFLQNMPELVNVYLNCLKDVTRWKDHPYQSDKSPIIDDDYQHTLEMLKISNDLKKLGVESINFDEIEIMILAHDGGEIITDDMSLYHSPEMKNYVTKVKELEPKVFMSCILRSIKDKELFPHRRKIGKLYKKYNSRQENKLDKESHLVKLIDMMQGDSFGLKNVYSKKRLFRIFNENELSVNPDDIMHKTITKSFSQLELVFQGIDNQSDKKIIFDYFIENYFDLYKNPEHGYQHIYENFLSKKEELFNKL